MDQSNEQTQKIWYNWSKLMLLYNWEKRTNLFQLLRYTKQVLKIQLSPNQLIHSNLSLYSLFSQPVNMASKQPFKFINITQKLTTWSIRINKFFKHRLLSKRKHVLLISDENPEVVKHLKSLFVVDKQSQQMKKIMRSVKDMPKSKEEKFEQILIKNMYKTWEINELKSINSALPDLTEKPEKRTQSVKKQSSKDLKVEKQSKNTSITKKTQQPQSAQQQPSAIIFTKFSDKQSVQTLQKHFADKKKYFDSIIVLPEKESNSSYPQINDEAFATDFISTLQEKIMKNVVAYRYASKFLNTSGTVIQSVSEYDFIKKTDQQKKDAQKKIQQGKDKPQDSFSYSDRRPPAGKQIIDATICYMGVVLGDRDHTDLNSWTLVSLGEEASWKNPKYVGRMYYDWADGQHLPMPGSFALFKRKAFNDKKELDFIQYL